MVLPSSAGGFQFVFCLLWGGRHAGLCWHSRARAALFFLLLFFPFRRLAGFSAERRWPSGQGPVAAAAPALAGWPAASARALCHRPAGSYGHRECRTGTGEATAHTDQAFCCDPPFVSCRQRTPWTANRAPSSHRARETHVRSAAGQERAHANIANE